MISPILFLAFGLALPSAQALVPDASLKAQNTDGRVQSVEMSLPTNTSRIAETGLPVSSSITGKSQADSEAQTLSKLFRGVKRTGWGTVAPVLRPRRSNHRRASTAPATPQPTVDVSFRRAGLGWTSDSGTHSADFTDAPGSLVGWTYDWNSHPVPGMSLEKLNYVPMAWGEGSVQGFADDSANFDSLGVSSLLSFNEPDQPFSVGGSDLTPTKAAALHQQIFNSTLAAKYEIGSPATARGGKGWMEQWITACNGQCVYDFVPLHFYGNNAQDMISYIKDFISTFGKKVWITEYACMDFGSTFYVCTLEETKAFNKIILEYMYNEPMVERYAAFGTFTDYASGGNSNGMLNADGTINELGLLYATTGKL